MTSIDKDNGTSSPRNSSVPLLGEGFPETTSSADVRSKDSKPLNQKSSKRALFGFGKKKGEEQSKTSAETPNASSSTRKEAIASTVPPKSPPNRSETLRDPSMSPVRSGQAYRSPSSPSRQLSSSPRHASPASSLIFERDVQEPVQVVTNSAAIPGHITTEDHIPPVLEASSLAITSDQLDPDNVEIVTHSAHQPAALGVSGPGLNESMMSSWQDEPVSHGENEDTASNYGALDTADVRRLSFVSFADVVNSEHAEHATSRDSIHLSSLSSPVSLTAMNRSASPVRSPISNRVQSRSPPDSSTVSISGQETSPIRGVRVPISPVSAHSPPSGELTIETMRQALRKTGSGDLSPYRSQPMSTAGDD